MLKVEVLLARMVPCLQTRSSSLKTSFLRAMPSKTASITRSTVAKSSKVRVGVIRLKRSSAICCEKRPRLTEFA